jgi:hypothetical protein
MPFFIAVALDCAVNLMGLIAGITYPDARVMIGGAALRLVSVGLLAFYALRGSDTAKALLLVLEWGTALLGLVFAMIVMARPSGERAAGVLACLAISVAYGGAGVGISKGLGSARNSFISKSASSAPHRSRTSRR